MCSKYLPKSDIPPVGMLQNEKEAQTNCFLLFVLGCLLMLGQYMPLPVFLCSVNTYIARSAHVYSIEPNSARDSKTRLWLICRTLL